MSSAITKITMVDSDFPQIEFSFDSILKEAACAESIERAAKREGVGSEPVPTRPAISAPSSESKAPKKQEAAEVAEKTSTSSETVDDILESWN